MSQPEFNPPRSEFHGVTPVFVGSPETLTEVTLPSTHVPGMYLQVDANGLREVLNRLHQESPTANANVYISLGRGAAANIETLNDDGKISFFRGRIIVDTAQRQITYDGNGIELPPREYSLTEVLGRNAGRIMTRQELFDTVWGPEYDGSPKVLDTHMQRVRRNLNREAFITRRKVGYMAVK